MVTATTTPQAAVERLGPADRIIQTLLAFTDHLHHDRPGIASPDPSSVIGVKWQPVTHAVEPDGTKTVYRLDRQGKKTVKARLGTLRADWQIEDGGRIVGRYQLPGLFPEAAAWMYRQVAEVWKLDNEFAARWASYAWAQEHKDLKVVLCALLLVQSRRGDPVLEGGKFLFHDVNHRDVGRAMILLPSKDKRHLDAKLVLRVRKLLRLPEIAAINRELGFGRSARAAFTGAWERAATSWLWQRETNPTMLAGLVKSGFTSTVCEIARKAHYKPVTAQFFATLRWPQEQRADGRFTIALDQEIAKAETWYGLDETAICERITREHPNWKRIVGLLPAAVGVTRAIMAAAIEAGALSDKDLICATPTLEELGLLEVQVIRERWQKATRNAEDMRAANIAKNVKTQAVREELEAAADTALKKQVAEVARDLDIYVFVDISGSMEGSIEAAKQHLARFVQGFPLDRLHVWVFNTQARQIAIPHASAAGVQNAFAGVRAGGGTDYGAPLRAMGHAAIDGRPWSQRFDAAAHERDCVFLFVGDEEASGFVSSVEACGLKPLAFGLLKIGGANHHAVTATASHMGIPCFPIDEKIFADPYQIPRTIRTIIASTPVRAAAPGWTPPKRETLVETILKTPLLSPPAWA